MRGICGECGEDCGLNIVDEMVVSDCCGEMAFHEEDDRYEITIGEYTQWELENEADARRDRAIEEAEERGDWEDHCRRDEENEKT